MSAAQAQGGGVHEASTLRLPVPFFDLLMVLLVTCLVFVAPLPPPETEKLNAMDVAIAHGKATPAAGDILAVIPRRAGTGWNFEISGEGQVITPADLARRATAEGRKVVLVVPPATALQDFVDMQTAIAALNVPFALAIKSKEAQP